MLYLQDVCMQLNLDSQYIDNYWKQHNIEFAKFLQQVSQLEKWTISSDLFFQNKINKFVEKCKKWEKANYAENSDEITQLMMYMNMSQFSYFLHYLDTFPGMSFHYVMEARSKEDWEAGQLLLNRLRIINDFSYLGQLLFPTRTRLIRQLLIDDDEEYEIN